MDYFLVLHNSYDQAEIGLFSFASTLLDRYAVDKFNASRDLIPLLDKLLKKHTLSLDALPFIVVNQGPGPFTTLRVMITSANGLSFASNIPLLGVNALKAAAAEWHDERYPLTVILFNAFTFDVYYAIQKPTVLLATGCTNIDTLLDTLKKEKGTIRFLGNGAHLYRDKIQKLFGDRALIPEPTPAYCSLNAIAKMGLAQWQAGEKGVAQLLPIYLKQHGMQGS